MAIDLKLLLLSILPLGGRRSSVLQEEFGFRCKFFVNKQVDFACICAILEEKLETMSRRRRLLERGSPMRMSMTGFGKAQQMLDGLEIVVELRSLNHRFLELSTRLPRGYGYLEDPLKQLMQSKVGRGKVELTLLLTPTSQTALRVDCNRTLALAYVTALRDIGQELGLLDDLTLSSVASLAGIVSVLEPDLDEHQIQQNVCQVTTAALQEMLSMRSFEGQRLAADLGDKLGEMDQLVQQMITASPQSVARYQKRLTERMQELFRDTNQPVDPNRLLQEVALFAERTAIDEELVRLGSHLAQFRKMLEQPGMVGRKLDFLIQELGREINCIGSKALDVSLTELVVEAKALLEKMREQLQNLE